MNRTLCFALGIVVAFASAAGAFQVTSCGQEVPGGQVGVLTADLDCGPPTALGSYGVELGAGATLDMQGHTITGSQWAIYCSERGTCHVTSTTGTGTVTGAEAGLWPVGSKVTISNVHFAGNAYGIANNLKTTLTDVSFSDNGFALTATKLRATNITITGDRYDGYCLDIGKGRIDGIVTMDTGASSNVVQVSDPLTIAPASMSGNPGQYGLAAKTIRISDSVVAGHGIDLAARRLRAVNVSCDHSRRFGSDGLVIGTWEVCAHD